MMLADELCSVGGGGTGFGGMLDPHPTSLRPSDAQVIDDIRACSGDSQRCRSHCHLCCVLCCCVSRYADWRYRITVREEIPSIPTEKSSRPRHISIACRVSAHERSAAAGPKTRRDD